MSLFQSLSNILLFCILTQSSFGQSSFYISPTGSDQNPGTVSQPWKSIQFGINHLQPGDTAFLRAGIFKEKITFLNSGELHKNITLKNFMNEIPIIDAKNIFSQTSIIQIMDQSYIVIDGLSISNNIMNDAQGILIEGPCENIIIRNCAIYNIAFSNDPNAKVTENTNAQPLIVYGTHAQNPASNIDISHNKIYDCRTGFSEALAVNGNVEQFNISYNLIRNITNIGIDVIGHEGTSPNPLLDQARMGNIHHNTVSHCLSSYATSAGIYIDGAMQIDVFNNYSYHNGYGIEIGCENKGKSASQIRVFNNVIYDNEMSGLALGGYDYPNNTGKVIYALVRNNTFYKNNYKRDYSGEMTISYCERCALINNIFHINETGFLGYAAGLQIRWMMDYNLIFTEVGANEMECDWRGVYYESYEEFKKETHVEFHGEFADPEFIDPKIVGFNGYIAPSSAARNSGDPSTTIFVNERDIQDETRIFENIVDIGADEYQPTLHVHSTHSASRTTTVKAILIEKTLLLNILLNSPNEATIEIWSASGMLIQKTQLKPSQFKLPLTQVPSGQYYGTIRQKNNKYTFSFYNPG